MQERNYYVYIMASRSKTLYVGVTNDLNRRVYEHKSNIVDGFSNKYKTHKLVYYECGQDIYFTIEREKQIKKWRREKKIFLIKTMNEEWRDLYGEIME